MNWYNYLILSLIGNIILGICLFSPSIIMIIHKRFFSWKEDSNENITSFNGRLVNVMTDARVEVQLEIETIIKRTDSDNLEHPTSENYYFPRYNTWDVYLVKFTNGYAKKYGSLKDIDLVSNKL